MGGETLGGKMKGNTLLIHAWRVALVLVMIFCLWQLVAGGAEWIESKANKVLAGFDASSNSTNTTNTCITHPIQLCGLPVRSSPPSK